MDEATGRHISDYDETPRDYGALVPDPAKLVSDVECASIAIGVVRSLADVVGSTDVGREQFLHEAGIAPARLDRPDERISFTEFNRIRELALDLTGDEGLGLRWCASLRERSLVPLSHLVSHCASLRQALELLARYVHVMSDRMGYDIFPCGDRMVLRYVPVTGETPRLQRCTAEMIMGGFWGFFACFAGNKGLGPVRFAHPAPAHRAEYERFFGQEVHFDQPHTEFEFGKALLEASSPQRDDEMRDVLCDLVEQRLNRIEHATPWSQRVRELLVRGQHSQRAEMEVVARGLGISVRTLRRRLADEGTSYEEVLGDARSAIAKHLLRDPDRPIREVAYMLGFADSSSFHRAFKRWTGTTPKGFRTSQLRPGG